MVDKQFVLFLYGFVGLLIALVLPVWKRKILFIERNKVIPSVSNEPLWLVISIYFLTGIIFSSLIKSLPWVYLAYGAILCSLIGAIAPSHRIMTAISMYLGVLVVTVLPWWLRPSGWTLSIGDAQSIIALSALVLTYYLFSKEPITQFTNKKFHIGWNFYIYIVFAVGVIFLVFYTGLILAVADMTTWHHWSAYIGPAKLMAAGAVPLRDIPIQYGLGSALILNLGCKLDCWSSMYWFSGVTTVLLTYIVAYIALKLNRSKSPISIAITLGVVTVSCIFWTAYPPAVGGALATPSTSGVRFLPGIIMLAWVLCMSSKKELHAKSYKWGHILWIACILWSPEAGIHATIVWVPYYVWTRTFLESTNTKKVNFLRSIFSIAFILVAGLAVSVLAYWSVYSEIPLPEEYLRYILLPPGAMVVNPDGTIWFAILCFACWWIGITVSDSSIIKNEKYRESWLIALLCFANFTYYLGRSHDNNILNLMPYFTLLLLATRSITNNGAIKTIATTLLSAILSFSTIFGWGTWKELYLQGKINVSIKELTDSYNRENDLDFIYRLPALEPKIHPTDAAPALKYIHDNYQESVVVLDPYLILNSGEIYDYWSALQVPTNFLLLPVQLRQTYLSRISRRLNKPGWVIYKPGYEEYIKDYDAVYDRVESMTIGSYKAIRYIPK